MKKKLEMAKIAEPGDIIINRIGRCANYWCICEERGVVSDCLIVVKTMGKKDIYNHIMNNSTGKRLNIAVRGVTTKFVALSDILEIL